MPVGRDWGNGAYVVATLRRPLDAKAQRMPGRAIGVQWFSIDRAAKTLQVDMSLPQLMRPNGTLTVPVKLNGLAAGEVAVDDLRRAAGPRGRSSVPDGHEKIAAAFRFPPDRRIGGVGVRQAAGELHDLLGPRQKAAVGGRRRGIGEGGLVLRRGERQQGMELEA